MNFSVTQSKLTSCSVAVYKLNGVWNKKSTIFLFVVHTGNLGCIQANLTFATFHCSETSPKKMHRKTFCDKSLFSKRHSVHQHLLDFFFFFNEYLSYFGQTGFKMSMANCKFKVELKKKQM